MILTYRKSHTHVLLSEQPKKDRQNGIARLGQADQDRKDRISRAGKTGQAEPGQEKQDTQDRTSRTGQA